MTNEELNTALYQKMFAEQEQYRSWLMTLPPQEILQHGYEYIIREDILLSVENNEQAGQGTFEVAFAAFGCVQEV